MVDVIWSQNTEVSVANKRTDVPQKSHEKELEDGLLDQYFEDSIETV